MKNIDEIFAKSAREAVMQTGIGSGLNRVVANMAYNGVSKQLKEQEGLSEGLYVGGKADAEAFIEIAKVIEGKLFVQLADNKIAVDAQKQAEFVKVFEDKIKDAIK